MSDKHQRRSLISELAGIPNDSGELLEKSELTSLLESYVAKEQACNKAVKYVQEHYDEIMDGAELQAEQILADATVRASAIVAEAQEQVEALNAEKARVAGVQHFLPKVKLDVGGIKYTTSLATLRRLPDTMIGAMFSGRYALPIDDEGYHFIDRDGTHFRHILNYLRSPETYVAGLTGSHLKELMNEWDFYGLPFIPIQPFLVTINLNSLDTCEVTICQDDNAIYNVMSKPIEVCWYCYSATTVHAQGRVIPNFKGIVDAKGGIVSPDQPRLATSCSNCGKAQT